MKIQQKCFHISQRLKNDIKSRCMKRLSLAIITSTFCLTMSGQQINHRLNSYRSGEMLTKQRVETDIDELLGSKGDWNLEGAEVSRKRYRCAYTLLEDTLTGRERGERISLRESPSQTDIIGTEDYMGRMSYDMAETWLRFPMQPGDSVGGYFSATGPYCERLFLRRFGTYQTRADARGRMTLPDGTTLPNVLRLHTERHICTKATPIDTMKYRVAKFTVDSIVSNMHTVGTPLREDVYRWYAEGYRYPVLEARTLTVEGERTLEEVFVCTPEVQEALAYDTENEAERQRLAAEQAAKTRGQSDNSIPGGVPGIKRQMDNGFAYAVSQDGGGSLITVAYDASRAVTVSALVASSQGYTYRHTEHQCEAGAGQFTIDCSGLRRGQYIIYI